MSERESTLKDSRRLELLHAASELLVQNPAASLADVADYAGIGKATLHRYFPSREDLMIALAQRAYQSVTEAIESCELERGTPTEAFARLMEAMVPIGDKAFFLLREDTLGSHPALDAADAATRTPVLALIQRGQSSGAFRADLHADWILHHMDYALFATWQAVHDGAVARKEAARLLVTTLLGGIAMR
jgi:AcrR family transcriptional regulator